MLQECAQFKWYYNAYLDTFNLPEHMTRVEDYKQQGLNNAPSVDWKELHPQLELFNFVENKSPDSNLVFCNFKKNENYLIRMSELDKLKQNKESQKLQKALERKAKRKLETDAMSTMNKEEKKEYREVLKQQNQQAKLKAKEHKKRMNKLNGKKPKTERCFPAPSWIRIVMERK